MEFQTVCAVLVLACAVDMSGTTLLALRSPQLFVTSQYTFATSALDVWMAGLLRASLYGGLVLGLCCSRGQRQSLRRLKSWLTSLTLLTLGYDIVLVAKLLMSMEFTREGQASHAGPAPTVTATTSASTAHPVRVIVHVHPWLWALMGWVVVMSAIELALLYSLPSKKPWKTRRGAPLKAVHKPSLRINADSYDEQYDDAENSPGFGEEEPLLVNEGKPASDDNSCSSDDDDGDADVRSSRTGKKKKKKKKKKKSRPLDSATICKLLSQSKPDWLFLLGGFLFLTGAAVSETFIPLYTGKVIDGIAIRHSKSEFHEAIIIMSVLSLVSAVCSGLRGGLFLTAMARLNIRIRNKLFGSIVQQEIGFFDTTRTGDITSRLTSDTTKMSDQISLNMNIFLRSIAKGVGVLVFMFRLSWKLTIVTLISIPLIAVVSEFYGEYYKKLSKAVQDSLAKANDVAEEVCSSMRTVRSFANETAEADRYRAKLADTYLVKLKQAVAYTGYGMTTGLVELVLAVVVLYYGGYLVLNYEMSAGSLVSFILYEFELGSCIEDIGDVFTGLMQAVGAADKVFELIERKPKISIGAGGMTVGQFAGKVEFQDVSFSYPARPDSDVLKSVSFSASPGEVVALVGPSGGGKTSCINLLERFYEPSSGSILLDGHPLSTFDHTFLHEKVTLVGQEPVLYGRSVRENIAYGLNDCSFDRVAAAARAANAEDFIRAMPNGFDTQTGEKGLQLSGGQKQRVAIARALVRNPNILLLDEATSALDAESEHLVQEAVYRGMLDRTVIIVAHRLSTVENATRIVVINNGQVAEEGTHQELVEKGGLYARLVSRQLHRKNSKEASSDSDAVPTASLLPILTDQAGQNTKNAKRRSTQSSSSSASDSDSGSNSDAADFMHL